MWPPGSPRVALGCRAAGKGGGFHGECVCPCPQGERGKPTFTVRWPGSQTGLRNLHCHVVSDSAWTTVSMSRPREAQAGTERHAGLVEGACPPPCPGRAVRPLPHPRRDPPGPSPGHRPPWNLKRRAAERRPRRLCVWTLLLPSTRPELHLGLSAGGTTSAWAPGHTGDLGSRARRHPCRNRNCHRPGTARCGPSAEPQLLRVLALLRARASGRAPGSYCAVSLPAVRSREVGSPAPRAAGSPRTPGAPLSWHEAPSAPGRP